MTRPCAVIIGAIATMLSWAVCVPTTARAQATDVRDIRIGRPGDVWLDGQQYQSLGRANEGTGKSAVFGYAVTYHIPGHGELRLFWPRASIEFSERPIGARMRALSLDGATLWYPERITATSLPAVHRGILILESHYAADARGAIEAMDGFGLVFALASGVPTLARISAHAPGATAIRVRGSAASASTQPRVTTSVSTATRAPTASASTRTTSAATTPKRSLNTANEARASSASTQTSRVRGRAGVANIGIRTNVVAGATTSVATSTVASPRVLARALERAGHVRPKGAAAHHIVAGNARGAHKARGILQRWGIGINDAVNGVFLPATRASANPTGASVHSTLHTARYYNKVTKLLSGATSRKQAERVLGRIRHMLLKGTL